MAQGESVSVGGKRYVIHYFQGVLTSSRKQKETRVSGTGSHGGNVTSHTIDHHEFFLKNGEGKEKSFKMVNWDFPCHEGQTLSVLWVCREGEDSGSYFCVLNHSSDGRHVVEATKIAGEFWPSRKLLWAAMAAVTLGLYFVSGFWGGLVLAAIGVLIYFTVTARSAAKRFLSSDGVRKMEASLAATADQAQPVSA